MIWMIMFYEIPYPIDLTSIDYKNADLKTTTITLITNKRLSKVYEHLTYTSWQGQGQDDMKQNMEKSGVWSIILFG